MNIIIVLNQKVYRMAIEVLLNFGKNIEKNHLGPIYIETVQKNLNNF